MRVLISGGAGFVGSHVYDALRQGGHSVLILDNFSTGRMENILLSDVGSDKRTDVLLFEGDISIFKTVAQAFQDFKPDAVVHLAAQAAISTSVENPVLDLTVNGIGTLNVLCAAKKAGVKNFIFSSTSAVYKHTGSKLFRTKEDAPLGPDTPYGISKLAAEMYIRRVFPKATILRFANVYGERQVPIGENQLLSRMIRHFKYGDDFKIFGSGNQKRDYVHVSDVVDAIKFSLEGGTPGTYNIATGVAVSVNEVATLVENYYGVLGYKWDHTETEDPRKYVCLDPGAAYRGLGWKAKVNIVAGVKRTIDWWERTQA